MQWARDMPTARCGGGELDGSTGGCGGWLTSEDGWVTVDGWVRGRAVVTWGNGEDVLADANGYAVMVGMVAW